MSKSPSKTEITLYHYWRSSCSWRVRWALLHKGINFQDQAVDLLKNEQNSPDFLKVNPSGYVPALKIGDEVFGESLAMLEWIEETYPNKPLLPSSPLDRMRVRQMCLMITSGTQPLQNLSVMRKHSSNAGEQAAWASHWIETGLKKLENLVERYAGTYCFGGSLSLADLCLVPQMYNARRFNVNVENYPTLVGIDQRCLKIRECEMSSPDKQKR